MYELKIFKFYRYMYYKLIEIWKCIVWSSVFINSVSEGFIDIMFDLV